MGRRKPHRPNGHSLHDRRGLYRLRAHAQITAVEIADPYGTPSDATARREPGLRRDGTSAQGEEWRAPEPPRLVIVRSLRGDQIARMEARHQISETQFAAGRHYQALHEIAFASALRSADPARPVIDEGRRVVDPFDDRQRDAIRRLRVIDGTLALRLGVDALALLHAVLLDGRSVVSASRALTGGTASYWRVTFRLDVLLMLGTDFPYRQFYPEGHGVRIAEVVLHVDDQHRGALAKTDTLAHSLGAIQRLGRTVDLRCHGVSSLVVGMRGSCTPASQPRVNGHPYQLPTITPGGKLKQ